MRKICTRCKVEKSYAEFIRNGMYRHPMCDPCRKEYQKKYQDKRRKLQKMFKGEKEWTQYIAIWEV